MVLSALLSLFFSLKIQFIEVILANKSIQISGIQLRNMTPVYSVVCSLAGV